MPSILPQEALSILDQERALLADLLALMERLEIDAATVERLRDIVLHLDDLFLVVVVGEFNSGKSTFLNALLGGRWLEEGPVPTTDRITVLRYAEEPRERMRSDFVLEKSLPVALLDTVRLVDTPGTNSIIQEHQRITEDFIPRADLVLFVTSYDRPLSESERVFLTYIRETWGKRLVFVLNKSDLARGNEDLLTRVLTHIQDGCRDLLGFEPLIIPLSSEQALAALDSPEPGERERLARESRFDELRRFVLETLTGPDRLAIKLRAPVDSALRLLAQSRLQIRVLREMVASDKAKLGAFESEIQRRDGQMRDGYRRHLAEVDALLLEMERRGAQFLDDSIRIGGLNLLRHRDRFKDEFARQVVRQHEIDIERRMGEAVDQLLQRSLSAWNWTHGHFADQARRIPDGLGSESEVAYNRTEVLEGIMREASRRIDGYDLHGEAHRLLENARNAAAVFLGAEALAAGIGVVVSVLVVAAGLDVTGGFLASGIVAALGLLVLPRQRRRAIGEFRERVDSLRTEMRKTLGDQFDREVDGLVSRLRALVAPFLAFVSVQRANIETGEEQTAQLEHALSEVSERIRKHFGSGSI